MSADPRSPVSAEVQSASFDPSSAVLSLISVEGDSYDAPMSGDPAAIDAAVASGVASYMIDGGVVEVQDASGAAVGSGSLPGEGGGGLPQPIADVLAECQILAAQLVDGSASNANGALSVVYNSAGQVESLAFVAVH